MAKEFIVYSKTKAEFEALVSSGEVDTSQMGIITETGEMWWNGEYRPIAETVPFANDLTGRIEATPEEFTFRPSAGDKSIRDESALIKRIKGNTIVWNQLVNISDTLNISFSENTDVYYQFLGRQNQGIRIIRGRKYLGTGYVETNIKTQISFGISTSMEEGQILTSIGTGYYERIFEAASDRTSNRLYINNYKGQKGFLQGDYISCTLNLFDLTQMFGAGNEPTTVEEFKALFPNVYYDYNAGELVSMTSKGLFANGFNQFNGEYAEVLPNNTYYLGGTYTTIGFTEEVGSTLEDITIPTDKLYTPTKKGYVYATGTNININLSHTGVRNGEYEPYWDATKDLSIIQKYFPNGMRSAGSIYDEISFDEAAQKWVAIQRVGVVDLGSLSWSMANSEKYPGAFIINLPIKKKGINYKSTINLGTKSFGFADYSAYADNTLYQNTSNTYLYAKFTSYSDTTSFKSAISGVMLYYELAEPIITNIEEPVDLSYKVGDFGIEKMLSDSFSAPFKADIIYQFNATDRVRENSMNISKLSKKHNLLESEVEALESKALTTEEQNFSNDQKAQVAENLGGNTTNGLVRYVGGVLPLKKISAPDANGVEQTYVLPNASDEDKGSANGVIATEGFVGEGYIPRPSGTSASKANKLLAYSDGRTYDSGVGIAQDVSDITNGATDSVPTSVIVKEYVNSQQPTEGDGISIRGKSISVKATNAFYFKAGQLDLSADITSSIKKGVDAKTAVDELNAVVSPTISGGVRVIDVTVTSGLIDDEQLVYALPSAPEESLGDADAVLATENYVRNYMSDNLPTEVATATQIEAYAAQDGSQLLYPNIMYEYPLGIGQAGSFVMPNIVQVANSTYDNRWMLRLPSIATSSILSFPYTIKWKDGVEPTFSEPCTLEIYLKEIKTGEIIGEWKIYR